MLEIKFLENFYKMDNYNFTIKTVKEAGDHLVSLRARGFETLGKHGDPKDVVTSVDLEIEKFIVDRIKEEFPDHGVYSEEGASVVSQNKLQWTIDPIDGTANFSRGIPHFSVCLGLLKGSEIMLGAVYNPVTNELFSFKKGKGAFLNGEKIRVSTIEDLKDAHVFLHVGRKEELREWGGESYKKLLANAKKTSNLASSALDACFVAAGRIEANIYGTLSALDIAPALGILKEAGGIIADEDGNFPELDSIPQKIYMANNKKILEALKKLL